MLQKNRSSKTFDMPAQTDVAWCPGCGNFPILRSVKESLDDLGLDAEDVVFVSGIGQAGKTPQYIRSHMFNGLHGRALPPATAIKAASPFLTVVVESGDGDIYGEGGNHFIHTIRRNPDITVIVHDNMVYGLTKGQASPTTEKGYKTPVQPNGVVVDPLNPLALAIALDAPFVARASANDPKGMREIVRQAIEFKGFALVDIQQPCIVFNKVNTYQWFKERSYVLEDEYDPTDRVGAFARAIDVEKLGLGVFYKNENRTTYEQNIGTYETNETPIWMRERSWEKIEAMLLTKR